jgi:outer membrane protein assembly factor BamB
MRSKDEAGASQEHRYYKRVLRWGTTICGGLAVSVSLALPVVPSAASAPAQSVPVAPQAAPAAGTIDTYERRWTTPVEASGAVELLIAADRVLVAADDRPLEARSIENGAAVWKSSVAFVGPPRVHDDRVIGMAAGRLQAVTIDRGEPLWTVALAEDASGSTLTGAGVVVVAGGDLRAYRAPDGAALWSQFLGAPARHPPVDAGPLVVVTLTSQDVAAFDSQTGQPRWRTRLDSAPTPMTAGRDHLFFGTDSGVCALSLRDGRLAWCFRTAPVPAAGAPLVAGDSVFFALRDNTLRAFDAGGGTLERLEPLPARPASGPMRAGTQMAVPLTTGGVVLVSLSTTPSAPVSAFEPPSDQSMRSAAASPDGAWLVTLTVDLSGRSTLTGYQRKTAPLPAKSP